MAGNANNSSRVKLNRQSRHNEWLELYAGGMSIPKIAERYEANYTSVRDVVRTALREAADLRTELSGTMLDLQLSRYEWLWAKTVDALDKSSSNREVGRAQLISSGRNVLDSMSKLLGLDQPQRAEITVHTVDALDHEIASLAESIREKARKDAEEAGVDAPDMPVLDGIIESVTETP
ncbi:hypothetical protein [Gordonia sp. (in: high G+C Gram-positive bacteria)]|uniref:hypothetical protein n=1 Tax=Gordonia sp. (in: high G+C Gram-positive bacteria) TaxID=84139 RepID=UPI00333E2311